MAKLISVVEAEIEEIKTETIIGANDPDRVGTAMEDIFDHVIENKGKIDGVIQSGSGSGVISLDLDTFTLRKQSLTGDVTQLNLTGGVEGKSYYIDIIKDVENRAFEIAPDYTQTTYSIGDKRAVPTTQPLGRVFYTCNTAIGVAEPFDSAKWDVYIKSQGDSVPVLSYSENEIDTLRIEPKMKGLIMYYSLTIVHNVGEK